MTRTYVRALTAIRRRRDPQSDLDAGNVTTEWMVLSCVIYFVMTGLIALGTWFWTTHISPS